jgi:Lar family restriction alleviation protein
MNREELLPCPFCGVEADLMESPTDSATVYRYFVRCMSPACDADSGITWSKESAVEMWNTRLPTKALQEECDRLREQLKDTVQAIRNAGEQVLWVRSACTIDRDGANELLAVCESLTEAYMKAQEALTNDNPEMPDPVEQEQASAVEGDIALKPVMEE